MCDMNKSEAVNELKLGPTVADKRKQQQKRVWVP